MDSVQIAFNLLTIVASGVVAAVVTFRLSARREDLYVRREKLEAVFRAFTGFVRQLGAHWVPLLAAMSGRIGYNEALRLVNAESGDNSTHLPELEMLVGIYFPELQVHVDTLFAIREEANEIIHVHKDRYREFGPARDGALQQMQAVSARLDQLEIAFRDSVKQLATNVRRQLGPAA